jgi:hypothetical protein
MSQTTTIRVNQRALTTVLVAVVCTLLGVLAGWGIFGQPMVSRSTVPATALTTAQDGGEEILRGIAPENLSMTPYTLRFTKQYATDYAAFIRPMSTQGNISWAGSPVVTWFGDDFIDVALAARTDAGVVMLELRLMRQSGEDIWEIDQLLSIQLREPVQ